jgi:hypothetical protein
MSTLLRLIPLLLNLYFLKAGLPGAVKIGKGIKAGAVALKGGEKLGKAFKTYLGVAEGAHIPAAWGAMSAADLASQLRETSRSAPAAAPMMMAQAQSSFPPQMPMMGQPGVQGPASLDELSQMLQMVRSL